MKYRINLTHKLRMNFNKYLGLVKLNRKSIYIYILLKKIIINNLLYLGLTLNKGNVRILLII